MDVLFFIASTLLIFVSEFIWNVVESTHGLQHDLEFCVLSLFKCQYTFNHNIDQFFKAIHPYAFELKSIQNAYAQFMVELASKYMGVAITDTQHRQLKYDIIEFIRFKHIMFIAFDHLQKWLYQLMTVGDGEDEQHNDEFIRKWFDEDHTQTSSNSNRALAEDLFNLMVMGMLYNDRFRIRPQLRGLLRFGSYYQIMFDPEIMFKDEQVAQYLNEGVHHLHHPFNPFKLYTAQIMQYNEAIHSEQQEEVHVVEEEAIKEEEEEEK
eukprot:1071100_1